MTEPLAISAPASPAERAAWVCMGVGLLEYVLNARIVGGEINAAAWEILVALFAAEAVFGVPGVIAAPIIYAYGKKELQDRGLV